MKEDEQIIVLDNYYEIIRIPKTTTKIFKSFKIGDIIHIELDMKTERGYRGIYAMYPRINGETGPTISSINSLISNGMELRKLDIEEVTKLINEKER